MKCWTFLLLFSLLMACSQEKKKLKESLLSQNFGGQKTLGQFYGDKEVDIQTEGPVTAKVKKTEHDFDLYEYVQGRWIPKGKNPGLVIEALSGEKYFSSGTSLDAAIAKKIIDEVQPLSPEAMNFSEIQNKKKISWKISPFVISQLNKQEDGALCLTDISSSRSLIYCEGSFLDEERFKKFKALVKSFTQHLYGGSPQELFPTIDKLWKESRDNKTFAKKIPVPENYQSSNWEIEVSRLEPSNFFSLSDFENRTTTVRVNLR